MVVILIFNSSPLLANKLRPTSNCKSNELFLHLHTNVSLFSNKTDFDLITCFDETKNLPVGCVRCSVSQYLPASHGVHWASSYRPEVLL